MMIEGNEEVGLFGVWRLGYDEWRMNNEDWPLSIVKNEDWLPSIMNNEDWTPQERIVKTMIEGWMPHPVTEVQSELVN